MQQGSASRLWSDSYRQRTVSAASLTSSILLLIAIYHLDSVQRE